MSDELIGADGPIPHPEGWHVTGDLGHLNDGPYPALAAKTLGDAKWTT